MPQSNTSTIRDKQTDSALETSRTESLEVPAAFREVANEYIGQAKNAYDQMRSAAAEASGVAQATSHSVRGHAVALTLKALGVAKTNTEASFDFFTKLVCAKTPAEAIELQTGFATKMFEMFTAQFKDLTEATQAAAADVTTPAQAAWEKLATTEGDGARSR